MYDRYLYLSRALGVLHAFERSHAYGFVTGKNTDLSDLRSMWGDRPWLDAAPIPGVDLGQNMLFHEYVLAQRVFGLERFPPIDQSGYLNELGSALDAVVDPATRENLRATLQQHGWSGTDVRTPRGLTPRRIMNSIRYRAARLWRWVLSLTSFGEDDPSFASEAEAVEAATRHRARHVRRCVVMTRLGARELTVK
jgi:hypothetical protein